MIYALNKDLRILIIGLDSVGELIKGRPIITPDRACVVAVANDIDWFEAELRDMNFASENSVEEVVKTTLELLVDSAARPQVDSSAFVDKRAAKTVLAKMGPLRLVILELRAVDEVLDGRIVHSKSAGLLLAVSRNQNYVREFMRTSDGSIGKLLDVVEASNKQAYAPFDIKGNEIELRYVDRDDE